LAQQGNHGVAGLDELAQNRRADESGGSGDQSLHDIYRLGFFWQAKVIWV
jgi:hypothetical protein